MTKSNLEKILIDIASIQTAVERIVDTTYQEDVLVETEKIENALQAISNTVELEKRSYQEERRSW